MVELQILGGVLQVEARQRSQVGEHRKVPAKSESRGKGRAREKLVAAYPNSAKGRHQGSEGDGERIRRISVSILTCDFVTIAGVDVLR